MFSLLLSIGLLLIPGTYAQEEESNQNTLYYTIKNAVEMETLKQKAELPVENFAAGIFYDKAVPMEMETTYVDIALQKDVLGMCGSDSSDTEKHNSHIACLQSQERIREVVDRASWNRALGRELQAIASGYEVGVEGYPGQPIEAVMRMGSIAQLWRAGTDILKEPFLETLTRAEPWPEGQEETIDNELQGVVTQITDLIREANDKEDDTEMVAAVWRYKNGVNYVKNHEGDCGSGSASNNPNRMWFNRRWCAIESQLLHVLNDTILANAKIEKGNEEFIIFPSYIDKENNLFIWIRDDDIGIQWYIPTEPMQAALYHPTYIDCLEETSVHSCYDIYGDDMLIRGGLYPIKQDETGLRPGQAGLFPGKLNPPREEEQNPLPRGDVPDLPPEGLLVPQPKEGEGICSHPFSKRGYLCRAIESTACDLTTQEQDELTASGSGGIILTRCQPERFNGDITQRISGDNICTIGGWKQTVEENIVKDTSARDENMVPNQCASCAVDIVCAEKCWDDPKLKTFAKTSLSKKDGVIEVCIPTIVGPTQYESLMVHEMVHAQQLCRDSNLQFAARLGYEGTKKEESTACCSLEREAYFTQCKMYAIEGVLEKAGLTIDQCASTLANNSCSSFDDNPDDDNYVCTNDDVDPKVISQLIKNTLTEMSDSLRFSQTCAATIENPYIVAMKNSMPLSCKPGCQTQYLNTIGNNLCYAGQCIEETHEWSETISGRSAFTTVDEAYPWNACEIEDPEIGQFAVSPAITAPHFPLYRPEYLMKQLDDALCQINGLPARTPPALCGFDAFKRLNLPPLNYFQTASDLTSQQNQYNSAALALQYAAKGLGTRIANEMFTQYLSTASNTFAELMNMSHRLFKQVGDITFPAAMCPRYADPNICAQLR